MNGVVNAMPYAPQFHSRRSCSSTQQNFSGKSTENFFPPSSDVKSPALPWKSFTPPLSFGNAPDFPPTVHFAPFSPSDSGITRWNLTSFIPDGVSSILYERWSSPMDSSSFAPLA